MLFSPLHCGRKHEQLIRKRGNQTGGGKGQDSGMTIPWAIPQRTADSRLLAPTPKMLPEMTWVVLWHAEVAGHEQDDGGRGFGGKTVDRLQSDYLMPHGLDDPPAAHGGAQDHGDDAHAFLGVVAAVGKGHGRSGNDLQVKDYSVYWSLMITVLLSDLPSGRLLS